MKKNHSIKTLTGRLVEIDGVSYQLIDGKLYRYADLTNDRAFKIVLGRIGSEEVLMHLLNRLLGTSIVKLEYRNTEHPGMTEEECFSRFDVYCEDEAGTAFQVEMQNWSQKYFNKRAVYYSSLVMIDQAIKSQREARANMMGKPFKWDYDYRPQYVLSFLNYKNWLVTNSVEKVNDHISLYRYKDVETGSELGDGTNIVFVDLYGFEKTIEECTTLEDIWMYSLKNMFHLDACPEKVMGTEIEELYRLSELAGMKPELRIKIEEEIMTQNDILNSIDEQLRDATERATTEGLAKGLAKGLAEGLAEGHAEGHAKGHAEGHAEGIAQAKLEDAGKLKALGVSLEIISQATGLDMAVIEGL